MADGDLGHGDEWRLKSGVMISALVVCSRGHLTAPAWSGEPGAGNAVPTRCCRSVMHRYGCCDLPAEPLTWHPALVAALIMGGSEGHFAAPAPGS